MDLLTKIGLGFLAYQIFGRRQNPNPYTTSFRPTGPVYVSDKPVPEGGGAEPATGLYGTMGGTFVDMPDLLYEESQRIQDQQVYLSA